MRFFLFLVAVVLIMALLGWITFNGGNDAATITIDKGKMQHDTETAVESIKEAANRVRHSADRPTTATPPSELDRAPVRPTEAVRAVPPTDPLPPVPPVDAPTAPGTPSP